jgi:hypothetical protein
VISIEGQARLCDLDDERRPSRVAAAIAPPIAGSHDDVGLGL